VQPRPPIETPRAAQDARRGPRAAQDRQHRSQDRPQTGNIGPKSGPGPHTEAPRATQDYPHRPVNFTIDHPSKMSKKRSKKKHAARQLHDRPSIENIEEEKLHRQNMLSVNFRSDRRAICPLTMSLYSDRSTLVIYIYIYINISLDLSLYSDNLSGQCRWAIGPHVDGQHLFYYLFRLAVGRQVHTPMGDQGLC